MIVGYTFNVENYCCDCMFHLAKRASVDAGNATMWGDSYDTEGVLHEWAFSVGVDRSDESTFDSSQFPKVITAQMARHDAEDGADDRCAGCGDAITGEPAA